MTSELLGAFRRRLQRASDHALGRRPLHLLHIGKTGGTALQNALRYYTRCPEYRLLLRGHSVSLMDIPPGEAVIFFLRDPIARFVSGFHSRKREGRPKYHVPWSAAEERAFQTFSTPAELARALSSYDESTKRAAIEAMNGIQHVRHSYWRWFGDGPYLLSRLSDILMVGRQESLDRDFERLKRLLDLPPSIGLPTDDLAAHRTPAGLETTLCVEARRNLESWYAADYRLLDFCAEHAAEFDYRSP